MIKTMARVDTDTVGFLSGISAIVAVPVAWILGRRKSEADTDSVFIEAAVKQITSAGGLIGMADGRVAAFAEDLESTRTEVGQLREDIAMLRRELETERAARYEAELVASRRQRRIVQLEGVIYAAGMEVPPDLPDIHPKENP